MNYDKLTQKSAECIQNAQRLALENGNQEICPLHILSVLIDEKDGLIYQMLKDMNVNTDYLSKDCKEAIYVCQKSARSIKHIFQNRPIKHCHLHKIYPNK